MTFDLRLVKKGQSEISSKFNKDILLRAQVPAQAGSCFLEPRLPSKPEKDQQAFDHHPDRQQ